MMFVPPPPPPPAGTECADRDSFATCQVLAPQDCLPSPQVCLLAPQEWSLAPQYCLLTSDRDSFATCQALAPLCTLKDFSQWLGPRTAEEERCAKTCRICVPAAYGCDSGRVARTATLTTRDVAANVMEQKGIKGVKEIQAAGKVPLPINMKRLGSVEGTESLLNPADNRRAASSVWGSQTQGTGHHRGRLNSAQGWSAQYNRKDQWYQIDAGKVVNLAGIAIQGRKGSGQWVSSFAVKTSETGSNFQTVANGRRRRLSHSSSPPPPPPPLVSFSSSQIFYANSDSNTIRKVSFGRSLKARYVRIYPQTWRGHMSMRCGLYLLDQGASDVTLALNVTLRRAGQPDELFTQRLGEETKEDKSGKSRRVVVLADETTSSAVLDGLIGWSNSATQSYDGRVHGPFSSKQYVYKTFGGISSHSSLSISVRLWAIDSWDNEYAYMYIDNAEVWKQANTAGQPRSCAASGWSQYNGNFYNPWAGNRATDKCYKDISIRRAHYGSAVTVKFFAAISQSSSDESFFFNRFKVISSNALARCSNALLKCPCSLLKCSC